MRGTYVCEGAGYKVNVKEVRFVSPEGPSKSHAAVRRATLWHDRFGHLTQLPDACGEIKKPENCVTCI